MLNKIKNNKTIAVVLAMVLLMTAVWVPMVASASGESWAMQLSKDSAGNTISYKNFDWEALGENLVPDPTVAHFDADGLYGRYIDKFDENYQPGPANPYYWWDKYIEKEYGFVQYYADAVEEGKITKGTPDADGYYTIPKVYPGAIKDSNGKYQVNGVTYKNGFQSLANRSYLVKDSSLTDDGTGLISFKSGGGTRAVPLPAMEADSYYMIKFNFKLDGNYDGNLELCLEPERENNNFIADENVSVTLYVGNGFADNKVDTVCYLVYTGDKAYTDPFVRIYCKDNVPTMFDDFGMYKVDKAYAESYRNGSSEDVGEMWAKQAARDDNGDAIDYKEFDWSALGTNLVPDPTVSHFDNDGLYGRYIDKFNENFQPGPVNTYYWWDKYIEKDYGFIQYYADAVEEGKLVKGEPDADGYYTIPKVSYGAIKDANGKYQVNGVTYKNGFQSLANRSYLVKDASLTDDNTGLISFNSGGGTRAVPMPAMEANSYYIIKFSFKLDGNYDGILGLCLDPEKENSNLIADENVAATLNVGNGFADNKVETVAFVVYTGEKAHEDPFFRIYCKDNVPTMFDDFGMYKVDKATATAFLGGEEVKPDVPAYAIQTTRHGGSNGEKIVYSGYDWDALGVNLVPDPTVAHFKEDGTYGKYAIAGAGGVPTEINTYYWWDKYIEEENGFRMYYQDWADGVLDKKVNGVAYDQLYRSPANRTNCVTKEYASLTNDGTGVLTDSSAGGFRSYPLPAMEADSYYVIKFKLKCEGILETAVDFCFEPSPEVAGQYGVPASSINLGEQLAADTVDTISFLVYTGSNTYSDPFVKIYLETRVFLDDFGMYKVTEEFASKCSDGKKLPDPSENLSKDAKALGLNNNKYINKNVYDFSSVNWGAFGANLIPDPTVSNFVDGVYGKYATPDANWKPTNINTNYWWDKYIDEYNGFTMHLQDMADGTLDKKVGSTSYTNGYQSPANRSMCIAPGGEYASLTDDGSGVLTTTTAGGKRYFPLPAMEKYSYYVVKFNMKINNVEWDPNGGFGINLNHDTAIYSMVPQETQPNNIYTFAAIVYTGDSDYSDPYFWFSLWNQRVFVDDICVYKVDATAGEQTFATGKPVQPVAALSETPEAAHTIYGENGALHNYKNFKWSLLGNNLVNTANKIEKSTQIGEDVKYELPKLEAYSYYLVKMKVDFAKVNNTTNVDLYNSTDLIKSQLFDMSKLGTDNNYITLIIYTGNKTFDDAYVKFWLSAGNSVSLSDFGVYKLKVPYAQSSITDSKLLPVTYLNTVPVAVKTDAIADYDYGTNDNLATDGSFEENAAAETLDSAKFGAKALKVTSKEKVEFKVDTVTYYMVSAWIKSANAGNATFTLAQKENGETVATAAYKLNANWNKVAMILYTSDVTEYTLSFGSDVEFYVDGLSVVKLSGSAHLACEALDSYVDGTYDPDRLEIAAPVFGVEDNMYSTLISPYFAACGENLTYREVYLKYLDLCDKLGNINEGYAPTGEGSRNNFGSITSKDEYNLIADGSFSNESYWKGTGTAASEYVAITNEYSINGTALKFTGAKDSDGKAVIYKKRITNLKPNTYYYLRINGMGLGNVISDADFGFMDTTYGLELRNPIDASRADDATYINTFHQRINFKCQDGSWYTRVYMFNTGENTELDFFIRGSKGTVYFDDIMLFEQANAYTITSSGKISDMVVLSYDEEKFACKDKDNLVPNGKFNNGTEFWGNFNGMGKFVEVVKSEGNSMLHFKGDNMSYYYLPWVEIKANVTYTFSFWKKNLNGEKSRALVVSEHNPHGYASQVYSVSEKYGEWELVSVKFMSHVDNRVALGIQSLDGEAVFDNVRLFESSKGYKASEKADMPVGGNTFTSTKLGTDGVAQNEVEEPEEEPGIEEPEEDEKTEDQVIETVTKKRRKKVIPGMSLGAIIAIVVGSIVGGIVLIGGVIFLIILFKKKKRKN